MAPQAPTQAQLLEILRYDPETGVFYWRVKRKAKNVGDVAGTSLADGRRHISIKNRQYLAYRLAWLYMTGEWPRGVIDHIDGDPSNDRWANLRDVTCRVNSENKRAASTRSTAGLLGVCKARSRWRAAIFAKGVNHVIGTYDTPELAHAAYLAAKRQLHEGCTI